MHLQTTKNRNTKQIINMLKLSAIHSYWGFMKIIDAMTQQKTIKFRIIVMINF